MHLVQFALGLAHKELGDQETNPAQKLHLYQAARQNYVSALAQDPEYLQALNNIGLLMVQMHLVKDSSDCGHQDPSKPDFKGAIVFFKRALAKDPEYAPAKWNLA